jgi:hypothetical protein
MPPSRARTRTHPGWLREVDLGGELRCVMEISFKGGRDG